MTNPKEGTVLFDANVITLKGMGRMIAEQHQHRGANPSGTDPITIAIAFGNESSVATLTREQALTLALEILGANQDELASLADRLPDQIVSILAPAAERALVLLHRRGAGGGGPTGGGMPEAS